MKLTLQTPLSDAQKATLALWLEKIGHAIAASQASDKAHKAHLGKIAALDEDQADTERAAGGGNVDACIRLNGIVQAKQRLNHTRQEALGREQDVVALLRDAINDVQGGAGPIFLQELHAQVQTALEEALAPFFHSRQDAGYKARDNDLTRQLSRFFLPPIEATVHELLPVAQNYQKALAAIIAGEVAFEFTPAHSVAKDGDSDAAPRRAPRSAKTAV